MYLVPDKAISQRRVANGYSFPSAISMPCPQCGRLVIFQVALPHPKDQDLTHTNAQCAGCDEVSKFVYVGFSKTTPEDRGLGDLFLYPLPRHRVPKAEFLTLDSVDSRLRSEYESAFDVYNAGFFQPAAITCRRVLEGITVHLLGPSAQGQTLAARLHELSGDPRLSEPIQKLADTLKRGGNLAAHFDLETEHDEHGASLMLDLLDDLIMYLFIVPERVRALEGKLGPRNG